ncbi:MAG: PIN domain-containing protein [Desulfobacterales bacterium]|nr:PIN domain-containing protein [Desulfobacterales bacterium]
MYVVLDSNIWISEWGLNTNKGSAVRFYIKQKKATLALPEIIKEEVERKLQNFLSESCKDIQTRHNQLLSVFGQLKEVVLPTEVEIAQKAKSLFDDVKLDLHSVPFTLESAKSSLRKIYEKKPPSDQNQQFKDGVIWANCLDLLEVDDVIIVTEDKAFFKGKSYKNGIAANLKKEANSFKNYISIYSSLTELLEEIKSTVNIDKETLISKFTDIMKDSMNSILERNGFSISSQANVNISPYVTEDPDKLYIEFEILFDCIDTRGEGRINATLLLKGDGYYASDNKELLELKNQGEELSFDDGSEGRKKINNSYASMNMVLGHRTVEHSIRYKIQ